MTALQRVRQAAKAFALVLKAPNSLTPVSGTGGWFSIARIRESYPGAWQQNVTVSLENVLTHPTVFACVTLIAFDVAKLRVKLVQQESGDIWHEIENAAHSPVLRKPNRYQNRIQFYQTWMLSKLIQGNTYILKQRDSRGVVVGLYVLDPNRVTPLVAPNGDVYYGLREDNLAQVRTSPESRQVVVPASEIIHDIYIPLYHPLVGVSPIHAAGVAATQALHIQSNSTQFFANGAMPGGLLTTPADISTEQAQEWKTLWQTNYTGENAGNVAVLGGGLKYEPMQMMSAVDAQVVDQLKWSDEKICSAYHVPGYKVGVGTPPPYNTVVQRNQEYYSDCIQTHLEQIEILLDEGLGLSPGRIEGRQLGTEFDLDGLLRMDAGALIASEKEAVGAGIKSPNEARRKLNLSPVDGGETPYLQQQNWPLRMLADRQLPGEPEPDSSNQSEISNDEEEKSLLDIEEQAGDFLRSDLGLIHA